MKRIIGWSVLFTALAGLIVLPWLMLDNTPAIEPPSSFHRADLAWVKSLFQKHDPRGQTPDVIYSIQLDEAELNRLLNYAVELRRVSGIAAELTPGLATLTATLTVPPNPFGRYLNITAEVADVPGGIRINSLQLGNLPLPGALADGLARLAHHWLRRDKTYATLSDAFSRVRFSENQATLDYRWHPELLTRIERKSAELLISPEDQARMVAYAERLEAILKRYPYGATVPLPRVVSPLFAQGQQAGDDVREENRAALTVNAGSRLANAIGLIKEEEDAGKGSGFSFTDLAANRSGVRLGERATGDTAAQVRRQLAVARNDVDLLPDFRDLPEFMPQAEFDRRFGPVGSARYQTVIARIDARLAAHPLLQ